MRSIGINVKIIRAATFGCGLLAMTPHGAKAVTVVGTETVLDRFFGVNLHLDDCCAGNYADLSTVIGQIKYIGAHSLRDWATDRQAASTWAAVRAATGASFHASIPEAGPEGQEQALARIGGWLKAYPGLIDTIEGGNEEDDSYPRSQGASLAQAASMQPEVLALGHANGVKVDQLSVGAGWRPPLYQGDYEIFGTPPADQGNAHIYMNPTQPAVKALTRIGGLAQYSVNGKPVDVTEFGTYSGPQQDEAFVDAAMHEAPFDAFLLGDVGLLVYALHDDSSGVISFYDAAGNKRPFADYWHHTTLLLSDPNGKSLPAKDVTVTFSDQVATGTAPLGIRNLPMYKSDGSLWIAAYDEERPGAPDGSETVGFDRSYGSVEIVDARTGAVTTRESNTASIAVPLPANHIYFVVAQ